MPKFHINYANKKAQEEKHIHWCWQLFVQITFFIIRVNMQINSSKYVAILH